MRSTRASMNDKTRCAIKKKIFWLFNLQRPINVTFLCKFLFAWHSSTQLCFQLLFFEDDLFFLLLLLLLLDWLVLASSISDKRGIFINKELNCCLSRSKFYCNKIEIQQHVSTFFFFLNRLITQYHLLKLKITFEMWKKWDQPDFKNCVHKYWKQWLQCFPAWTDRVDQ